MFAYCSPPEVNDTIEAIEPIFGVTEKSVVMLDIQSDLLAELRRLLMSMGVEVFYGLGVSDIGPEPLLIFDSEGFNRSKANGRYDYARKMIPDASLCVVLDAAGVSAPMQAVPELAPFSTGHLGLNQEA